MPFDACSFATDGKVGLVFICLHRGRPQSLTTCFSSGAGKTTLLDVRTRFSLRWASRCLLSSPASQVLASRKTIGVIGGTVLINGRTPGKEFQRGTAYVLSHHRAPSRFRYSLVLTADSLLSAFIATANSKTRTNTRQLSARRSASLLTSANRRRSPRRKRISTSRRLFSCSSSKIWRTLLLGSLGLDWVRPRFRRRLVRAADGLPFTVH
jgi:hypothetical protein